ncbi:MAG: RNA methyltransferase [Kangiellaceae bacterium]|jgi:TrmH family RNA methyltransferase|nr:RNA methyltransferase [Kangiellaceae bacterium]
MVTKHQLKLIKSLAQKKYRQELGLFIVEGVKGIHEFLNSEFKLEALYTTEPIFDCPKHLLHEISELELNKMSMLKTPNKALATFKIPKTKAINEEALIIALDDVRDPGNLGTIIRLCDWFGVEDLVCNKSTVDCYNPKVIQASMGSLARVNITYLNLLEFCSQYKYEVIGTFMKGHNLYDSQIPQKEVIVFGNEANGISKSIKNLVSVKLAIPRFGENKETESLNVATAAAIILGESRRQSIGK